MKTHKEKEFAEISLGNIMVCSNAKEGKAFFTQRICACSRQVLPLTVSESCVVIKMLGISAVSK